MSRSLLLSLLLSLSATGAVAAEEPKVFTMTVGGELTVGTDGRVVDVELFERRALGAPAADGYETMIRDWRFEPVLVDGVPVQARARMQLSLEAHGEANGDLRLGVRDVWFTDAPGAEAAAANAPPKPRLSPPRFPNAVWEAGAGGLIHLLVHVRPDGSVVDAAAESVEMFGPPLGRREQRMADRLISAAVNQAKTWSFPGYDGFVLVPVRFNLSRYPGWVETRRLAVALPAWALVGDADDRVQLGAAGEPESALRLQSPLGDVPTPPAGG